MATAPLGRPQRIGKTFVFLDLCMSGGIIEGLTKAVPRIVGCTTATRTGKGYDSAFVRSGAWTNSFLRCGLMPLGLTADADLVRVFREAYQRHTATYRNDADRPCFFARTEFKTYNTEPNANVSLPTNTFRASEWL